MTKQKYLLDTNIVIGLLRGKIQKQPLLSETELCINSVVLGELLFGAFHAQLVAKNLREIIGFVEFMDVIPCTSQTVGRYAYEKENLTRSGLAMPTNDLWIAATAL